MFKMLLILLMVTTALAMEQNCPATGILFRDPLVAAPSSSNNACRRETASNQSLRDPYSGGSQPGVSRASTEPRWIISATSPISWRFLRLDLQETLPAAARRRLDLVVFSGIRIPPGETFDSYSHNTFAHRQHHVFSISVLVHEAVERWQHYAPGVEAANYVLLHCTKGDNDHLVLLAVYVPPSAVPNGPADLSILLRAATRLQHGLQARQQSGLGTVPLVVTGDLNARQLVWRPTVVGGPLVGVLNHGIATNTAGARHHASQLRQMAIAFRLRQYNSVKRWPDFTQLDLFFARDGGDWRLVPDILELTSVDCAHVLFTMAMC